MDVLKFVTRSILAVLTFAIGLKIKDVDDALELIQNHPDDVIIILLIMIIFIICLIGYIYHLLKKAKKREDIKYNMDKTKIKHSILIFDDKTIWLNDIKQELAGTQFEFLAVKNIEDYRFAECFDIIIGDIMGVGAPGAKNSIPILNAIKTNYPYKIVIAMSNGISPDDKRRLLVDDFVSKENRDGYTIEIKNLITKYSKKMDDIESHWTDTEIKLKEKGVTPTNIEYFKDEYYNSLRRKL